MPVKVIAFVTVNSGKDEAFVAAAAIIVAASRAEPGVMHYDLWREIEGERRFVFNELYRDEAAVQSHMTSAHFRAFGEALQDLVAERPIIISTEAVNVLA